MTKKTKILLGALVGVVVIALGIGVWAFASGKFKSSASGSITNNYIEGHVACPSGDCPLALQSARVVITTTSGQTTATTNVSSSGYFRLGSNIPINTSVGVWVYGPCSSGTSPRGFCGSEMQYTSFDSIGQTKPMYFKIIPASGKLLVHVQTKCIPTPRMPCKSTYLPVSGAKVVLSGQEPATVYTNADGNVFAGVGAGIFRIGDYNILVYATGYQTGTDSITVKGCDNNVSTVTLVKS